MNRAYLWFVLITLIIATTVVAEQFSYKFTLPTNLVLLNSVVNGTSLRLTSAYASYAGLAYYPTKVSANLGFSTNFTWVPESCSSPSGAEGYVFEIDETSSGTSGSNLWSRFAFFLTKDAPTMQQVSNSVAGGLGVSNVPNTYMVGYSAYAGQFYLCEWTSPLLNTFDIAPQCTVANVSSVQCGGRMHIKINFDGTFWTIYTDNTLSMRVAKGIDLETYYVGLSGSTDVEYFQQSITQWSFQSTTGNFIDLPFPSFDLPMSYYGDAVPIMNNSFRLTSQGSQAGAVSFGVYVNVLSGFKTQFTWTPSNCETLYDGADGFAFFASSGEVSNASVLQSQGSGLGVQYIQGSNVVMAAYSATFNEFYICNWTDPRPDLFRYVCYTVANPSAKLTCGSDYLIEVSYLGNLLSMSVNGQQKIATTDVVFSTTDNQRIGISGATGQGYFQQDISNWTFRSNAVQQTSWSPELNPVGSAVENSLTDGPNQYGAFVSRSEWLDISYKFESSFTWTGSDCFGTPTQGFSHYFSRLPPTSSQIQTTPDKLGIGNVADVYMMGYDILGQSLYICDWGAVPTGFSSSICSSLSMPNYSCGTPLNIKLTYDSFDLRVYINDTFKLSRSVTIFPRYYYRGFTGVTTSSYMTQNITNWTLITTSVFPVTYTYVGLYSNVTLLGSAKEVPSGWIAGASQVQLTNDYYSDQNAGLMLSPEAVPMKYGFILRSYWNATNCDPVYNGGDGFAFVFTKVIPDNNQVLASNGTGLGIQQVPNVTMIGYSSYYNEFYICSWDTPLIGLYRDSSACQVISLSTSRLTCNSFSYIEMDYDGHNFRFSFSPFFTFTFPLELVNGGPFPLDLSVPYHVGVSGSIGNGYYEQNINYF